ncbi:MAG TPA: hypothetical protein VL424_14325 [Pararobbsia sp.]|jgi:hypothetical protein|nr:hypothetical protein [Pararobbsia sp.]
MDQQLETGNTAELDQQQGVTQQADQTGENEAGSQTAEEREAQEAAAREAAKPKVDNVQRRIDEITRKRHEEVNRERARADAAERELAALRTPKTDDNGQPTQVRPEDIDRIANQRADALVVKREFDAKCTALVDNGSKEFGADFDKAVKTLGSLQAIVDEKGEFTDFAKAIVESDEPHKLMKHLGDNPDEAARILLLNPTQQAREIGRLEARLSTQPATQPAVSKAPPPPSHVGTRNVASAAPSDKDDIKTWMAKREAQVRGA